MIVSQRLADTRRWAFYEIGAQMCAADTGTMHGHARYAGTTAHVDGTVNTDGSCMACMTRARSVVTRRAGRGTGAV